MATLMEQYQQWEEQRQAIWDEEAEGWDEFSSDDMGLSDDDGIRMLEGFVLASERFAEASQRVIDAWESGNLAEAVNILSGVLYDYRHDAS